MKKKIDLLLEYLEGHYASGEDNSYTTEQLSKELGIARNNVSTLLNRLVAEDKVMKTSSRPVLYKLNVSDQDSNNTFFTDLIGYDRSLSKSIRSAKAAVMYPAGFLPLLIRGESGCGMSALIEQIIKYANQKRKIKNIVRFNSKYFTNDPKRAIRQLFQDGENENGLSMCEQASNGILYINHMEKLSYNALAWLSHDIERGLFNDRHTLLICSCSENIVDDSIFPLFPITLDISSLQERGLDERNDLISHFLMNESNKLGLKIQLSSDAGKCLLLYKCKRNIKELSNDIHIACAYAYSRELGTGSKNLYVHMDDFPPKIKKGILLYPSKKAEVDRLINESQFYELDENQSDKHELLYNQIEKKAKQYRDSGLNDDEISTLISADIQDNIHSYNSLNQEIYDRNSITKIVDEKTAVMVEKFLNDASEKLNKNFDTQIYYGLCMHIDALLKRRSNNQYFSSTKVSEFMKEHPDEFNLALSFSKKLEDKRKKEISIDETILIAMFLIDNHNSDAVKNHAVLLIAMHGSSSASSIANVVNELLQSEEVYSFDLDLKKNMNDAYLELKSLIARIDRGGGILLLYDMGSLKTLAEMAVQETGTVLKSIEIPSTLIALDFARKLRNTSDINSIYQDLIEEFRNSFSIISSSYDRYNQSKAIITLCMSGQGAALLMKQYIEKNVDIENCDIIPLAISDRRELTRRLNELRKERKILCLVGTYNPDLIGMRFLQFGDLLKLKGDSLKFALLDKASINDENENSKITIYKNLKEMLPDLPNSKLKKYMSSTISTLKKKHPIDEDIEIGLIMHISCVLERLIHHEQLNSNSRTQEIITRNKRLYQDVKGAFSSLESAFNVNFPDSEIAYILELLTHA